MNRLQKIVQISLYTFTLGGFWTQSLAQENPTYSKDIAPILQDKCDSCHNPEGIGPMPLQSYEQVKPFAALIHDRTSKRIMPPWHIDTGIGIQSFKNDASLNDEQIDLIERWFLAGSPEGNPADLPALVDFPSGAEWQLGDQLGPPDLVIKSSPYDVIANGQDQWWTPNVPFEGLNNERFLKAAEFKPSYPLGKKVVHHGHAVLVPEGGGRSVALARYGVGKSWEMFPEGTGMRVPANGNIAWNLHYFPVGAEGPGDVVEVGLWFYPEGQTPEKETVGEAMFRVDGLKGMARGQDIVIPPHGYQVLQGTHRLNAPAVIHSYRPHLHMRGKVMTMEAIYPDGRKEVLSQVNNYDHNWQIAYIYEDDVKPLLPTGTILQFTSVFDNTCLLYTSPSPRD